MATKSTESDKQKLPKRKQQTVRERSQSGDKTRAKRIRSTAGKITTPIKKARTVGRKEYHVVPVPSNRAGAILQKRVRFFPKFIREAWGEIKQVTWPDRHETVRLTFAVFIFAVIFAVIVGALDFGLDKLFREVVVKR